MAERFNLTAQLQLQAPTNVRQVVGDIRRQLSGLAVDVQVKGNTRALAQVNKQMQSVSKSAGSASKNVNNLSRNLSEAARRFSVITVATGTMLALARAIKDGVGEAIQFERELVRISQVTGKTTSQLKGLTQEVTRLATGLGASSKDLLNVSRTLAQAGFSAEKTKQALDILAKTSLGATFDSIQDTTEGAIAVLRQFRKEARQAGGDIKFLENTLDAINSVSKNFAVESGDLITVIRRVGGVFEAAGGSVNELIALFTSVRATTRESAETISTGLRTIFTRIQRTDTVDQLKALGIELRNSQGQFVGAFEAVRRLSVGLSGLDPRDYRFSEIVESLGGFRQIGKVIPLIRQFQTAQDALNVAQTASGSVARDAAVAQQSLAVQAGKVAQEFKALMREFADSSTFKSVAQGALEIARAMIRVADALEPVLPMLGILAGLKIGQGVAPLLGGLLAGGGRGGRGGISKFASGGYVPGSGNRDTVPAMLTPGEFVIKKSSAKKLGPATLSAMNNNRFATGGQVGIVALKPYDADAPNPLTLTSTVSRADVARKVYGKEGQGAQLGRDLEGKSLGASPIGNALKQFVSKGGVSVDATGSALGDAALGTDLERAITDNFVDSINMGAKQLEAAFKNTKTPVEAKEIKYADAGTLGIESVIGNAFEGIIASLRGGVFSSKNKNNANFDFISGIGTRLAELLRNPALGAIPTDAKRTLSNRQLEEAVTKKYKNQLADAARDLGIGKGPVAQGKNFNKDQLQQKAVGLITERKRSGSKKDFVTLTEMQKEFKGVKASDLTDAGFRKGFRGQYTPPGLNSGGQVDNVPALLTPGEFVINKKSAQSIGYGNLNSINKSGVARFQNGGIVGLAGAGKGGARAFRAMGQAGISQFAAENDAAARQIARFAKTTAEAQAAMITYSRVLLQTKDGSEALRQASLSANAAYMNSAKSTKQVSKSSDQLNTATKSYTQRLKGAGGGRGFGGGGRGGRGGIRGAIGRTARELDPVAGAAQTFVFAGAAAAALASQFGGLNDVTQQAITETSGFIGSIVGLGGTMTQIFTSMALAGNSAASADIRESAASDKVTESNIKQSATGSKGMSVLSKGLIGASIAATAVAAGFKYFAAQARAQADAIAKSNAAILQRIKEGEADTGFAEGSVSEAERRSRAASLDTATNVALGAGLAGGVTAAGAIGVGAASGAAFGATLAPFTLGLSIAAGALIGLGAGLVTYYTLQSSANAELEKQAQSIRDTANALVSLEQSAYKTDQAFADLQEANISDPQENIRRRLAIGRAAISATSSGDAEQVITDIAKDLGKGFVTEADLEGNEAALQRFKLATQALAKEQDRLRQNTKNAFETLDKASQLQIVKSGEFTFDELINESAEYAQALAQVQTAIEAETQSRIRATEADIQRNQITLKNTQEGSEAHQKALVTEKELTAQKDAEIKRGQDRLRDLEDGQRKAAEAAQKFRDEAIQAAAAAAEYRESLDAIRRFNASLTTMENKIDSFSQSLDNSNAIVENTALNFASPSTGLDNLTEIEDLGEFNKRIKRIAKDLPEGANVSVKAVTETAKLLQTGRKNVLDLYGTGKRSIGEPVDVEQIIKDSGFDLSMLGDEARKAIRKGLADAMAEGGDITPEEFDKIFAPAIELGQEQAKAIQRGNDLLNKEIEAYQGFLDQQQQLRNKALQAEQKAIDLQIKGAELRAKARGDELSIEAKERARTASAQRGLQGTGLRAGDAAGARDLILRNNARRREIQEEIQAGKRSKQLADEDARLRDETAKATNELSRLTDQSARAADILGELDKERAKQDAAIGILQDFVTGGVDQRRAMLTDAAAVNMAIRTGTIQNQSEEQRSRTFALLDRLKDIELVQDPRFGGMTGSDVKKFLTLSDSVRLGLISQEQAFKAMTQTTKEEQLIKALDNLAGVINQAAGAEVDIANANVAGVPLTLPSRRFGGRIGGRSHASGGVPIEAEGGEYIIRKESVAKYGERKLNSVNNGTAAIYMKYGGGIPKAQMGMFVDTAAIDERARRREAAAAAREQEEEQKRKEKEKEPLKVPRRFTRYGRRRGQGFSTTYGSLPKDFAKSQRRTPGAIQGRQTKSAVTRQNILQELQAQRATTQAEKDDIIFGPEAKAAEAGFFSVSGRQIGASRREAEEQRRLKEEQEYNALIKRSEVLNAQNFRGGTEPVDPPVPPHRQRPPELPQISDLLSIEADKTPEEIAEEAKQARAKKRADRFAAARRAKEQRQREREAGTRSSGLTPSAGFGGANLSLGSGAGAADPDRLDPSFYAPEVKLDRSFYDPDDGAFQAGDRDILSRPSPVTSQERQLKSRAQILKQRGADPRTAFGPPARRSRSAAAVQRAKFGFQGSRSGSAVQARTYGMDHFAQQQQQQQQMGAQFQRQQQPGMRRGGFTGQGGVQAASAGGGGLSIDPSQLQGVMSQFVQEFSNALNNMTNPIKTVANTLSGLASAMQNLTLNVEFSGEAQMSLYIENIGDIKAKLTEHVTSEIERLVVDSSQADKPASREVNSNGDG